jgi:polar amino acid transport system substrate-binding protein
VEAMHANVQARSVRRLLRWFSIGIAAALSALTMPATAADWAVGANIGNVPWEFQNAQGQYVGFEIDLVNEVAKRVGRSVQFENIPFNGLFSAVQSNRVQIAISSISITPRRLATLGFAQPYYDSEQSLSVTRSSKIMSLEDLSGKTVGVDTASTGDIWATTNQARYKINTIARYEGLAPAMLDLANGRIDGYISDLPAVQYYIKDKPQYRVAVRIASGEKYSFMFAKSFADAARIQSALNGMKQDGFVARIYEKWLGAPPAADSSSVKVLDGQN